MRIPERQKELDALVREYLTDPKPEPNGRAEQRPLEASDEEVLALCRKAKNAAKFSALYDVGDTSLYEGDESRADLALVSLIAFYTQDFDQLDRLFDNSALGQRSKWKNRPDYRVRTIDKALQELRETYTPPGGPGGPGGRAHLAGGGVQVSINGRRIDNPECFNLTDLGNAERFIAQHGRDARYCFLWAKWLVWTGSRWERDDSGRVRRMAKETVRGIYGEAAAAEDDSERKALAKHATASEAEGKIKAMLELAKSDVPVSPDDLDADPWLLNAPNGTVNLKTGEIQPHRREDLLTKIAGTGYDPDAPAPAWDAFLERVLPGDELRRFVRKAVGYSATGEISEQCLFINHGVGSNGKSTFQEALSEALGDYSMRAPTEMLMVKRSGGIPNDVARLKGARFVSASETEQGRHLAESLVKDLTGQDTITARFMRAEFFDFEPTHKLWLSTNHKPIIRGTDLAIWRRIRLVPWAVTIPPQEQNKQLSSRIQDELPGVLSWVVRGCLDWRREGLAAPDEVRKATGGYRSEMDSLGDFLEDRCVVDPDTSVAFNNLWKAYREWCLDTEEKGESKKQFGMSLTERGLVAHKGRQGTRIRRGLRLKEDFDPDSEKRNHTGVAHVSPYATSGMSCKTAENTKEGGAWGSNLHINTSENNLRGVNVKTEPPAPPAPPAPPEPVNLVHFEPLDNEVIERVRQALEYGNAPKEALENYRNGDQDIDSVVKAVMHYRARGQDDVERWRAPVIAVVEERAASSTASTSTPPDTSAGGLGARLRRIRDEKRAEKAADHE